METCVQTCFWLWHFTGNVLILIYALLPLLKYTRMGEDLILSISMSNYSKWWFASLIACKNVIFLKLTYYITDQVVTKQIKGKTVVCHATQHKLCLLVNKVLALAFATLFLSSCFVTSFFFCYKFILFNIGAKTLDGNLKGICRELAQFRSKLYTCRNNLTNNLINWLSYPNFWKFPLEGIQLVARMISESLDFAGLIQ